MTFRTGRRVGRTIYAMLDDEPGDGDQLVGVMDTAELADMVVRGLNAPPVEGSTPLDSPARSCGMHYSWPSQAGSEAGTLGPCVLDVADHHERHRDGHGNEWLNVQWALDRLDAAPAGEVDTFPDTPGAGWGSSDVASGWTTTQGTSADFSTPAADMRSRRQGGRGSVAQAGEPVPVPSPVDAEFAAVMAELQAIVMGGQSWYFALPIARRLYDAGVAEGRRQAAHAITEETATFCMDGVGRHLVEVCTKLAAGKRADHG